MGNLSSCFKPQNSNTKTSKLVDSQGQIKLVELPITVAEIMLENPGFALASVDDLRRTRRIPAMTADESLVGWKVYLLVPVDRVNSRLTDSQLHAIDSIICTRSSNKKRTRGGSKISPVESTGLSGENFGDFVKDLGGSNTGQAGQRKRFDRGWAPVLEPILEGC